ncbi:MAG: type II toxin-antitoxin system RelE/ParE family toxin [Luteolibacter sp.]|uniref:type II toxin-antitoxin system RelE/ParE family toxin n=1 Tax=Luteolibacter sp. TaxID=1962973 RepID=UPI0032653F25
MTFDFHSEAREEFHDAVHWYEDRSTMAADRFVREVRAATDAIMSDPTRYQPMENGVRVFRLKKYPFRIYYLFDEDSQFVCIYAVMHEKKRADYWRKRIGGS